MINRKNLGVVASNWPRLSIPDPVRNVYQSLAAHLPPEVQARQVGHGYHNAGWGYIEIEIQAPTQSRAEEMAERIWKECSWALQMGEDQN